MTQKTSPRLERDRQLTVSQSLGVDGPNGPQNRLVLGTVRNVGYLIKAAEENWQGGSRPLSIFGEEIYRPHSLDWNFAVCVVHHGRDDEIRLRFQETQICPRPKCSIRLAVGKSSNQRRRERIRSEEHTSELQSLA